MTVESTVLIDFGSQPETGGKGNKINHCEKTKGKTDLLANYFHVHNYNKRKTWPTIKTNKVDTMKYDCFYIKNNRKNVLKKYYTFKADCIRQYSYIVSFYGSSFLF